MAKPPKDDATEDLDALLEEPDDAPDFNTVLTDEDIKPVAPPAGNRGFILILFLLASLIGGAIGWIGPKLGSAPDPVIELETSTRMRFADINTEINKKNQEIKALQSALASTKRALDVEVKTTQAQSERIADLSSQLAALSASPAQDNTLADTVSALEARLEELEGLKILGTGAGNGEAMPASNLIRRLEALESAANASTGSPEALGALRADLDELKAKLTPGPTFPQPASEPIELPKFETAFDREKALGILIDTFPRDKMVEAVRAQEQLAAEKPSWLKRVLSRHVQVREAEEQNPIDIIDEAERSVRAGRVDLALEQIGTLNPPVRAVAAQWIKSAKKFEKNEL